MLHFDVCGFCWLLNDSGLRHSIYSYLATFYTAVRGIRSNHCHFLWRTVTSAWRYFPSFSGVGKEPIKPHPAEVQWPNTQNANLATPLKFCIHSLWNGKEGRGLWKWGSLSLFKWRAHVVPLPPVYFFCFPTEHMKKRKKKKEKKGLAWTMIFASNGRIMAHSRKTEKMG